MPGFRFLIVTDVVDNRMLRTQGGLFDKYAHPRPAAFAIPREIVAIKKCDTLAASVDDFPDPHVRVINRDIESFHKANAKQLCRCPEYAITQNALESKIGLKLCFIDSKFRPAHLFCVIEPVPRCRAEVAAFLIDNLLNIRQLLFGSRPRRRSDSPHKGKRLCRGARHLIGHRPAGKVICAQQLRFARADCRQPQHQLACVIRIALLISRPASCKKIFSRLPILQRKQRRLLGGIEQRKQPAST